MDVSAAPKVTVKAVDVIDPPRGVTLTSTVNVFPVPGAIVKPHDIPEIIAGCWMR